MKFSSWQNRERSQLPRSVYMLYSRDECRDEIRPNIQSANTEAEKQTPPTETTVQIVGNHDRPREKHEVFKLKR